MKNIPKILLKTYLRRQPVHLRLQRFNFLTRYSWLKNLIEDLRPELFPPEEPVVEEAVPEAAIDEAEIAHLIDAQVRGKQGTYQVERWLGKRGQGNLFAAFKLGTKEPVVLKEFLLPRRIFSPSEARQRQQQFENLAGLSRADGRSQDFRIVQTLDAIADTHSLERCYLVTHQRDAAPTLRKHLAVQGALPTETVREVLVQVLQTLLHLHQQRLAFPSGQRQAGVVHGNLTLDSLLWVDSPLEHGFVYLTDLALWERIFDPPTATLYTVLPTSDQVHQDLRAVAEIGAALMIGQEVSAETKDPADWELPNTDPYLTTFVQQLATPLTFDSAETAWQALLRLPRVTETAPTDAPIDAEAEARSPVPRWLLSLVGVLALGALASVLWQVFLRERTPASPMARVCCFREVGAVPEGQYVYTGLDNGSWRYILDQRNLGQRGRSLTSALREAQPELSLDYFPVASIEAALAAVQAGEAEFAILPQLPDLVLPAELGSAVVAYDGLAVFVAFSYAERQRGLPQALGGELTLTEVNDLYVGTIETWRELSGAWLPVERYAPENPEAIAVFEQQVLDSLSLDRLSNVERLEAFPLFRAILQDFENQQLGSIGFAPLSQVFGQCSIYPLALQSGRGQPVQPLILSDGEDISPNSDLCNRKGAYFVNGEVLKSGEYPLAYATMVVFPQDNGRVPVGQKFVELLRTDEGQQLLREAGLTPFQGVDQ